MDKELAKQFIEDYIDLCEDYGLEILPTGSCVEVGYAEDLENTKQILLERL